MKRLILLAALMLWAIQAWASVTYTSDVDKTPATGLTIIYSGFAVSGSNPVIIVLIGLADDTATVSSMTCTVGLSCGTPVEVITVRSAGSPATYLSGWCLPAPSGNGIITATLSASVAWQSNAILLAGADQTTPCPVGAGNVGSASGNTPNPLTITLGNLTTGEIGIGIGAQNTDGDAPTFNQTQTFNNNTTNINAAAGYRIDGGAISVTWSMASATDSLIALRIVAAAGSGAAAAPRLPLLGVGP